MIITCPNCGTHYDVKPEAIKPTGSMMRCARCGYAWQQSIIHSVEVREQQVNIPVAAAAAPVVAPPPPPPPPPPAPEPEPLPEPEPEPEPLPEPEPEPEQEPEAEADPLSQDELDNLFGEDDDAALSPIESMIDTNIDDDEAETIEIEGDDLDPIPSGFSEPMHGDDDEIPVGRPRFKNPPVEKKKPIAMIIAIVFAVLFIGTAATGFLAKDAIIKAVPAAKDYYIMMGIHKDEPGEGLAHQDVKARRDVKNGIDYLIVEGKVANVTETLVNVPVLKVALTNTEGKEIRVQTMELSKTELKAGESIDFKVEFENPPGTARSMALGFVNAADMAMDEGAAE